MKVFISSPIGGFEVFRDAAASGIETLGHEAVRAEDFGALPESPQQACLAGVRDADALVLILGAGYGQPQASGLSATHEEYREARDAKPVLAFVQEGINPDSEQKAFKREVQGWEHGHFTAKFHSDIDLQVKVIRGLHDLILANEAAPLDEVELANRARALISTRHAAGGTDLLVAIAGGPRRAVLRPGELDSDGLHRFLLAEALTGADAILTTVAGTDVSVRGDEIRLIQNHGSRMVTLNEAAELLIILPAIEQSYHLSGIPSLIEEVIAERIKMAFRFSARVLDHIDSTRRISHFAPAVGLRGARHLPWRTRTEQERSPNTATMGFGVDNHIVVVLSPAVRRRPALSQRTQKLAEDFTVRLRRQAKR